MILITDDKVIVTPGMSKSEILFHLERVRLAVMNGVYLPEIVAASMEFQDQRTAEGEPTDAETAD